MSTSAPSRRLLWVEYDLTASSQIKGHRPIRCYEYGASTGRSFSPIPLDSPYKITGISLSCFRLKSAPKNTGPVIRHYEIRGDNFSPINIFTTDKQLSEADFFSATLASLQALAQSSALTFKKTSEGILGESHFTPL